MDKVKIASHYAPVVFAVSGGWVGSSAVAETGQRWMSAARTSLRLPAAGWMSEMVNRSTFNTVMNVGTGRNSWGSGSSYGFNYDEYGIWGSMTQRTFGHVTLESFSFQNNDYIFVKSRSRNFTMSVVVEGWGSVTWWIDKTENAYAAGGLGAFIKARLGQNINMLITVS